MTKSLLIATTNPGKTREIKALLSQLSVQILDANALSLDLEVDEVGSTYEENACLKAKAYLQASDHIVLADDSGLEVDALGGAPGIHSARLSPKENATDADRRNHLLQQLKGIPGPWYAHFHCTAVLATLEGEIFKTEGRCDGIIIPEERGSGGFGYDPIFFLPEYDATMAELPAGMKNRISHRARAITALIPTLKDILSTE